MRESGTNPSERAAELPHRGHRASTGMPQEAYSGWTVAPNSLSSERYPMVTWMLRREPSAPFRCDPTVLSPARQSRDRRNLLDTI